MKDKVITGVLVVAAFSALSYYVVRDYQRKINERRQMKDFIHFQLF